MGVTSVHDGPHPYLSIHQHCIHSGEASRPSERPDSFMRCTMAPRISRVTSSSRGGHRPNADVELVWVEPARISPARSHRYAYGRHSDL
jgi:hypothetical protein